jgi:hypothetical protein
MARIVFGKGKQHEFFNKVIEDTQSPSLRSLLQYGISSNYTQLKNFYTERRTIPKELFLELCTIAHIDEDSLNVTEKKDSWGQVIGGQTSKRGKNLKVRK